MFKLEEFLSAEDSLLREFAFTLNLDLFDAEDIVQEAVLLSIEEPKVISPNSDIFQWFIFQISKLSQKRNNEKPALALYEFDFPDFAPFLQSEYKEQISSLSKQNIKIETSFEFLFFLQYMNFEQRLVLVMKNFFKNEYVSLSSKILGIKKEKISEIIESSKKQYSLIFNKWKNNIPFPVSNEGEEINSLMDKFKEALKERDKSLLEKIFFNDIELVVSGEKRTGNKFVSVACLDLLKKSGKILYFDEIHLNGCSGILVWSRSDNSSEWNRSAVILLLANEKFVCSLKWYFDTHLFRNIVCGNPPSS